MWVSVCVCVCVFCRPGMRALHSTGSCVCVRTCSVKPNPCVRTNGRRHSDIRSAVCSPSPAGRRGGGVRACVREAGAAGHVAPTGDSSSSSGLISAPRPGHHRRPSTRLWRRPWRALGGTLTTICLLLSLMVCLILKKKKKGGGGSNLSE